MRRLALIVGFLAACAGAQAPVIVAQSPARCDEEPADPPPYRPELETPVIPELHTEKGKPAAQCYMIACQMNDGTAMLFVMDGEERAVAGYHACRNNGNVLWVVKGCTPEDMPKPLPPPEEQRTPDDKSKI